jgi:hypothetical protein
MSRKAIKWFIRLWSVLLAGQYIKDTSCAVWTGDIEKFAILVFFLFSHFLLLLIEIHFLALIDQMTL